MARKKSRTWSIVKLVLILGILSLAAYGGYQLYQPYASNVNRSFDAAQRAMDAAQNAW
jgi:hypothetical protein